MFKTDLCNYSGQDSGWRSAWKKGMKGAHVFSTGSHTLAGALEPSVEHIKIKLVTKKPQKHPLLSSP